MKFKTYQESDLSREQLAMLPSENEIDRYDEIGWHVSPFILPEELIDEAVRGAEAFYRGERDWTLNHTDHISNDDVALDKRLLNNEMTSLQKMEVRDLINYPTIGATAMKLARTNSIRMFADGIVHKKPVDGTTDQGIVGWHADRPYWPTCSSHNMMTAWIPLQDCTIDMGPVFYISGSHKWRDDLRFRKLFNFNNQNLDEMSAFLKKEKPDYVSVPMTLKKGQVSFHHGYTIHASRPNTSSRDRIAIGLHLQDGANHYVPAFHPDGNKVEIGYDLVCRKDATGQPDYADPAVFPELFRAQ
jgi:ectoine hydroxylase-related dioxygenase (phytanoyl-CoA dioxygenase family)